MAVFNKITFTERRPVTGEQEQTLLAKIADHRRTLSAIALTPAARTAVTSSSAITNHDCAGVIIWLALTAVGTGNMTICLDAITANGDIFTFAQTAVITTTGNYALLVYPGAGNAAAGFTGIPFACPRQFRVTIWKSDGSAWTYSASYDLIP